MIRVAIFISAFFCSQGVLSDSLIVGGFSKHLDNFDCDINETHPSLGFSKNANEIGLYKNSFNKTSFFVGKRAYFFSLRNINIGYRFGIASGYSNNYCYKTRIRRYPPDGKIKKERKKKSYYVSNIAGVVPQAQGLITYKANLLYVDIGISPVLTLTFRLPIN